MTPSSIRGVIADTCFWIDAFDPRGSHHKEAAHYLDELRDHVILMPWPIMYEVLRTRTIKNPIMTRAFERVLARPKIYRIDDTEYRDDCIERTFSLAERGRHISLVDMVVRAVITGGKYRITQLLTFNVADFQDVCHDKNVSVWPSRNE